MPASIPTASRLSMFLREYKQGAFKSLNMGLDYTLVRLDAQADANRREAS
jgi:hypothetical protein